MPRKTVGILIVGVLAAFSGAAGAEQHGNGTSKAASQPATASTTPVSQTNTAATKFVPVSRDVCAKHPNLKQCS